MSGGAERVLVLLANHFQKKGHDVSILTFNGPDIFKPIEEVERIRLHHGKIKNHKVRSIFNLLKYYRVKKNRPNILIPFIVHTNLIGIIVGKIYRIKTIASEHNNHLEKTDLIGDFTRKIVYKYCDALTVLTGFDKLYYEKRNVNTFIMPNPCSFNIYEENKRNRSKYLLAVGDLDRFHHKGFDNLIKILAPVFKDNPDWKLKLVGGGEKGAAMLKDLAMEEGIYQKIIFEGFINNVSEIMRDSEIFIMTSRFEGLPMVLIEAMSQGMACISYDCISGPSDIIDHNINGILVENQNSDLMAKEISMLIKNNTKRKQLAKMATKSLDRFNIDEIYNKYLKIINSL